MPKIDWLYKSKGFDFERSGIGEGHKTSFRAYPSEQGDNLLSLYGESMGMKNIANYTKGACLHKTSLEMLEVGTTDRTPKYATKTNITTYPFQNQCSQFTDWRWHN